MWCGCRPASQALLCTGPPGTSCSQSGKQEEREMKEWRKKFTTDIDEVTSIWDFVFTAFFANNVLTIKVIILLFVFFGMFVGRMNSKVWTYLKNNLEKKKLIQSTVSNMCCTHFSKQIHSLNVQDVSSSSFQLWEVKYQPERVRGISYLPHDCSSNCSSFSYLQGLMGAGGVREPGSEEQGPPTSHP